MCPFSSNAGDSHGLTLLLGNLLSSLDQGPLRGRAMFRSFLNFGDSYVGSKFASNNQEKMLKTTSWISWELTLELFGTTLGSPQAGGLISGSDSISKCVPGRYRSGRRQNAEKQPQFDPLVIWQFPSPCSIVIFKYQRVTMAMDFPKNP